MNDLPNFDPIAVADEIAALETEAQDKLAEAEDEFKSRSEKIAAILWDVKQHHPEHLDAICERAKIGRSRRKELLQIGRGSKTIEAQDRDKSHQRPAGPADHHMAKMSPIDLSLFTRQGAQTQISFRRRPRSVTSNDMAELALTAAIAALLHHCVQACSATIMMAAYRQLNWPNRAVVE
jgi:hypothetical protein